MLRVRKRRPLYRTVLSAILACAALALAVGAMSTLLQQITFYADDYEYACYFRGGFSAFWEKTVNHYRNWNGRALVHFVAELFMLGGTGVYAVLFPPMMAAALVYGNKCQSEGEVTNSVLSAAASMLVFLALPVEYLNQSLCWMSASFNYCFPFLLIFPYFALLAGHSILRRRAILVFACVLAFLAGATTEQCGMIALFGGLLIWLMSLWHTPRGCRRRLWRRGLPILFSLVGYLTVMLAPGTSMRLETDGSSSSFFTLLRTPERFWERFQLIFDYLCGRDAEMPRQRCF